MQDVLDNPTFHALSSGNLDFANGDETVKYFAREVAPFAGMIENSQENFNHFFNLVNEERTFALISPFEVEIPQTWKTISLMNILQMVHNNSVTINSDEAEIVTLNKDNVDEMIALTKLTNPGPFSKATLAFKNYKGIFKENKLVAMAGYRLHVYNFREVSAVCTHPDHCGKGYAKKLILNQIEDIQKENDTAFLHVKSDNQRAIKLYEHLGFSIRKFLFVYSITKTLR